MRRTAVSLIAVGLLVVSPHAQAPNGQRAIDAYAQEPFVFERLSVEQAFEPDGATTSTVSYRARVQSAAALSRMGTVSVPYMRELGTADILTIKVHKPDGSVVETPGATAIDMPAEVTQAAPTYTDLYVRNVNVRALSAGDTLEVAYRVRMRSLLPGYFWSEEQFVDDVIVLDGNLTMSVPDTVTPIVKSPGTAPAITTGSGRRTYRWHYTTLTLPTGTAAATKAYADSQRRADVQISSFRDWAQLGTVVRDLWRDRTAVTPAIRSKAEELTRGATSDEERLRAIYQFVATKIRYVAVSFGIGRLQPHPAEEVLNNGFGDCKDKHTLLVAMLDAVGIRADAALIAPGAPFDSEVPSPAQFNHVITVVNPNGPFPTWLDTTLEVAPMGVITFVERNQDVLVVPRTGTALVVKTPVAPSRDNLWRTTTTGTLSAAGTLDARVTETVSGDNEILLRTLFRSIPPAQWPDLVRQLPVGAKFGGTASDIAATTPEDTSRPFEISYRYVVENFSNWKTNQVEAALPIIIRAPGDDAAVPFPLGGPLAAHSTSRIELPDGFSTQLVRGTSPETIVDSQFGRYELRVALKGRTFDVERRLTVTPREVTVADLPAYRKFFQSIGAANFAVALTARKPWAWREQATIDWYAGTPSETQTTLQSAVTAANRKAFDEAAGIVDGVLKSQPESRAAWAISAWVQRQKGDRPGSVDTLRAHLGSAPASADLKLLGNWLTEEGRTKEAVEIWRRGYNSYPEDREFPLYLGEALQRGGEHAEALKLLTAALPDNETSPRLQWNLGMASLGLNQQDNALTRFRRLIALDPAPVRLNDAAYNLAVKGWALDEAYQWATKAVQALETETKSFTLAPEGRVRMVNAHYELGAYWDTLGWVAFKRRDFAEAERYLTAAWELIRDPVIGAHLGEVHEARGNVEAAKLAYARATAVPGDSGAAVKRLSVLVPDQGARSKLANAEAVALLNPKPSVNIPRPPEASGKGGVYALVNENGTIEATDGPAAAMPSLRPAVDALRGVAVPVALPREGAAKVLRAIMLVCDETSPTCSLALREVARVPAR